MTTSPSTAAFAGEVVTRSIVRYFDVPGLNGEFALITLDNGLDHTRPSTFGLGGLASLADAIAQIRSRQPKIAAVGVTGKPFVFAVGADLTGIPLITAHTQAVAFAREGHRVFAQLSDFDVATFAFVNGAALGGGLELALHCDYRTVSSSAGAIAFPECFLGLVPGWGGTQLLPNLIGAENAVTVIIDNALNQNRMLSPAQATALGICDVQFDSADFLAESLLWAAGVTSGAISVDRVPPDRGDAWDAALAKGKLVADARVHGSAPAPYRALELMKLAQGASFADGAAAEDLVLADLVMGDELRSSLYAFDLVNRRAKRPVGAPDQALARPVGKVGIVGAGLMASQLALLFVRRLQVPVVLTDVDQARLDKGVSYVHHEIDQLLAKSRIGPDQSNRLKALVTGSLNKEGFADADFVIEAVFEELSVKKSVFAELEEVVAAGAILATNTSSLSVTEMAAGLEHPERVVGFHFFNPVAVLPLLEIVRGAKTSDAALATALAVGKQLRKSAVLISDAPAFVVNRLLTRFIGAVTAAVDEGTPIAVADRALAPLGLPMTPFALLGLVGPAVALHVSETMHGAFGDRFPVSANLRRLVEAGKPGIYQWDRGRPTIDPEIDALFVVGDRPTTEEQVRERALSAVAEEVSLMLADGVVAQVQDIDLCLLLGAGWPFHLGGITPYLDRTGVSTRVTGHRFLPPGVASVPGRG